VRAFGRTVTSGAFFVALGCMQWSAVPLNPAAGEPMTLRLHLRDGSSVIAREAVVSADSIVGLPWGSAQKVERVSVARAQVEQVDVGETDPIRTTYLILGIFAAAVGTLVWQSKKYSYDPS
jgi:hypothetical protein